MIVLAAEAIAKPRLRIKIEPRSFAILTTTHPTSFHLNGQVGLYKEPICHFRAFKTSRFDESIWQIYLVEPKGASSGWIDPEFQAELVKEIESLVLALWEVNRPLVEKSEQKKTCPRPSHCRKMVTLSAAAASCAIVAKIIKAKQSRLESPP